MKALVLGVTALAVRSVAQHQYDASSAGKLSTASLRIDPVTPSPIRARKRDAERVHFDIYERIQFEIFERVQFSLLPDPPWKFNITIGNQRQHIGSWWGPEHMAVEMKAWLNGACKQTDKWDSEKCNSDPFLRHIEMEQQKKAKFLDNGASLRISSHFIPEVYGIALQEAFIEQIVDTFVLAVNNDKNCYFFDRLSTSCLLPCVRSKINCSIAPCRGCDKDPRDIIIRWCNAPDYVRVAISDRNGIEKAHMRVDLQFIQETWQGKFDCMAIVDEVAQKARIDRTDKLKAATKAKVIEAVVVCPNKEVTGSCPNEDCTYRPGMCFLNQKDSGYWKGP